MICFVSSFILLNTNQSRFSHFHACVLWCSVAVVCHHDLPWLLLRFIKHKSHGFLYFRVCVSWRSVAAVCHYDLLWQAFYYHVCVLVLCSVAAACHHDLLLLFLRFINYRPPIFLYLHACVSLCSVAAACHHDLFRPLLCFINYNSPKVFISIYVCCCALSLLCATMIWFGSFFVWLNTDHTGFFISTSVCVVVLSSCCLPPWLALIFLF